MSTKEKKSRYVVGIDLGTTNCALTYLDTLEDVPTPKVLAAPQWETEGSLVESETLPSFYYLPPKSEWKKGQLNLPFDQNSSDDGSSAKDYVVGRLARQQSSVTPGRVIHSAKSWLCHGGVDREERILPWHSDDIIGQDRRSPIEVSAAYLEHLKNVWDAELGAYQEDYRFANQDITITVPASFDEVAQRLTLEAAETAGYPMDRLRLLEEPQAAFYHWLSEHRSESGRPDSQALLERLPQLKDAPVRVLICDIGGGTTDFSLFEIAPIADPSERPDIKRIAVSDHILLGGDNIDLSLAHELEKRLKEGHGRLSARQWAQLTFEARKLKERALAPQAAESDEEDLYVSVAGEGSGLFASTLTTSIKRDEIVQLVESGFLPPCGADEAPKTKVSTGLQEFGLPYAADSAMTRQMAGFLEGAGVDAVLYTGGTLKPAFTRERLSAALREWQGGRPVTDLVNEQMDLAVSLGAAYYGYALRLPGSRIRGGYPRSVYVEVAQTKDESLPRLVCILPKGSEPGRTITIDELDLKVLTERPARFQLFTSTTRESDDPGTLVDLAAGRFHPLPPLHTKLDFAEGQKKKEPQKIHVNLEVHLSETGILEVYLVHKGESEEKRWRLNFNVRAITHRDEQSTALPETEPSQTGGRISLAKRGEAVKKIDALFGKKKKNADEVGNPKYLVRELEETLGMKRDEWDTGFLRSLWPSLSAGMNKRSRSAGHETSWFYMAGYSLRPGYGFELDEWRVSELWQAFEQGMFFPKERQVEEQWWIMWRRVAGGLGRQEQERLFDKIFPGARKGNVASAEHYMLIGSLERVDMGKKVKLGNQLVQQITEGKKQYLDQKIWALARMASRVPLYSGPQAVIRPKFVADWISQLKNLDTSKKPYDKLNLFFSQAARMVGDRQFDVDEPTRRLVIEKLRDAGAPEEQIQVVREHVPVDEDTRAQLFGEALPSGLLLD